MSSPLLAVSENRGRHGVVAAAIVLLCVLAAWATVWPVYRAFCEVEIDCNEGWNAYFADAAMGSMPLYPSADQLIRNNYPPLSFYVVGAVGQWIGDPVLAGRLLSLLAVAALAGAIGMAITQLEGSRAAALVGAASFLATLGRFCTPYVGMNDPQLLAQAIMAFGFVAFLRAIHRDCGYLAPLLVMVAAGFFKHNIITMPLAGFLWLALRRPNRIAFCAAVALAAAAGGLALCTAIFGRVFLTNLCAPRGYDLIRGLGAISNLQYSIAGVIAWAYLAWCLGRQPVVRFVTLWVLIGMAVFLVQKTGSGVDMNAQFDLLIALSVAVGLSFHHVPWLPIVHRFRIDRVRGALVLGLCLGVLIANGLEPVRVLFDPTLRDEAQVRQRALARDVARVRALPGDVLTSNLVCYRSGKRFAVDLFSTGERIRAGELPPTAIDDRIARGELTLFIADPRGNWDEPMTAQYITENGAIPDRRQASRP